MKLLKIIEMKKEFPKEIIFSGHSLGGALATISALNYGVEYPDI